MKTMLSQVLVLASQAGDRRRDNGAVAFTRCRMPDRHRCRPGVARLSHIRLRVSLSQRLRSYNAQALSWRDGKGSEGQRASRQLRSASSHASAARSAVGAAPSRGGEEAAQQALEGRHNSAASTEPASGPCRPGRPARSRVAIAGGGHRRCSSQATGVRLARRAESRGGRGRRRLAGVRLRCRSGGGRPVHEGEGGDDVSDGRFHEGTGVVAPTTAAGPWAERHRPSPSAAPRTHAWPAAAAT